MGSHIIDGEFQSDKYPTTPRGKVPLSVRDVTAQDLLWRYAQRRRVVDAEFAVDLESALVAAGYRSRQAQHVEAERVRVAVREAFATVAALSGADFAQRYIEDVATRTAVGLEGQAFTGEDVRRVRGVVQALLDSAVELDGRARMSAALATAAHAAEQLLADIGVEKNRGLDTNMRVFFYEQEFYALSNFSAFSLRWKGYRFDTSEAAYHWEKFPWKSLLTCSESNQQWAIRLAPSAHEAFRLGQALEERRPDWDAVKVDTMRELLRAKVEQHPYVRKKLLETGDRELVENSWRDDFWGWGPNRDGQNMLGRLWMEIRGEIREGDRK